MEALTSGNSEALLALYRSAFREEGAEVLAAQAAAALENPLLIADSRCLLLTEAGFSHNQDSLWGRICDSGRIPEDYVLALQHSPDFRRMAERDAPVFMADSPFGCPVCLCRMTYNGLYVGFAMLVQTGRSLTAADGAFLQEFCGIESTRLWTITDQEERLGFENLMKALLEGRLYGDRLRFQLTNIGLPMNQFSCLMVVQERHDAAFDVDGLLAQLRLAYPKCRCMQYRDRVLALIPLSATQVMSPEVRANLKDYLRKQELFCGCSNSFRDMGSIPLAYEQASTALRIGMTYSDRGPMLYLWEFAVYQICDLLHGQYDLTSLYQPMIRMLESYDRKNHTRFLETLRVYIGTGCSVIKTAELLGVHRNTIDYRLDRLRQNLSIDVRDPNLIYSFFLSFQIMDYLEKKQDRNADEK